MQSRKIVHSKKNDGSKRKPLLKRFVLVTLSLLTLLSGVFWAQAETVPMEFPRLSKVGPIHEDNGYPVWYKDSKGARLQLCLDVNDPLCALPPEEVPNPTQPISLKTGNFPHEAFYQLASSALTLPNGGSADGTFALEAAWKNEQAIPGDQIVFGRVRLRVDGLVAGQEYTITHPYGIDKFVAEVADEENPTAGEIRFVEDIGIDGGFTGALESRIGTFLKWDEGAPEGYIGDPNVNHKIVGGINDQNFFRIEGPGIGTGTCGTNCAQTDLFSLMGKIATTAGVDIARATYSRTADGGTIDVFASTVDDAAQTIEVSGFGGDPVTMKGTNGQYFVRVPFTGDLPSITVSNVSDKLQPSVKTITPIDMITATANYDVNSEKLVITAASGDQVTPPVLTLEGFNQTIPAEGLTMENPAYVPHYITISSSAKGRVTIPVNITAVPIPTPVANAGPEQTVEAGQEVTLQGSNTGGPHTTVLWEQVSPATPIVALTGADTLTPKFTAPAETGTYEFKLTLTGKGGTSTSNVVVNVGPPVPLANAGADQSIKQNTVVTLDGSASKNATAYTWNQTGGTAVTLDLTNPAKPTFIAPKKAENLTFDLTVTGPDGKTSIDQVTITTVPDVVTVITADFFRATTTNPTPTWRVDGRSDVVGPGVKINLYVGEPVQANLLATVDVTSTGTWSFRGPGRSVTTGQTLTIVSTSGGKLTGVPIRIR